MDQTIHPVNVPQRKKRSCLYWCGISTASIVGLCLAMSACLVGLVAITGSYETGEPAPKLYVIAGGLTVNLRQEPSEDSEIVARLTSGDALRLLDTTEDGTWYQVMVSKTADRGWIFAELTTQERPTNTPKPPATRAPTKPPATSAVRVESASGTRFISSQTGVNVRSSPSTSSSVLGSLGNGDEITLTGKSGDWYRINYRNGNGWVHSSLTSTSKPVVSSGDSGSNGASSGGGSGTAPTSAPSGGGAVCSCAGNIYNCPNFSTRAQAQACFNYCVSLGVGDIHRLDGDNNGLACENLP